MTPNRNKARLAEWQRWLLSLSGAALWLSGGAWLLLHYFGQAKGEFGLEMNPLEPWMMKAHGLALIPGLLGVGGLFVAHIPKGWTHAHQRTAGIALGVFISILIISGYLLYYIGAESPRVWIGVAHWSIGLLLPAIFAWHYVNGSRGRRGR